VREIVVESVGLEGGLESFRRDFEWISRVRRSVSSSRPNQENGSREVDGLAALRLWRPAEQRVSAGRFHRIADGTERIQRRLSGGRMVGLGPGSLAMTLVAPSVAWLDPKVPRLKPEQVLNRALRPLLAVLRGLGLDAFYPGRDVVTVGGRPIAYAAFTTLPDGVVLVEMYLGLSESFQTTPSLVERWDPDGVAAIAPDLFADAVCLSDFTELPDDARLSDTITEACRQEFASQIAAAAPGREPGMRAGRHAWSAFQGERGPIAPAAASAAGMTMLGVTEVDARILEGRFHSVNICGDLVAPFRTLAEISSGLENQPTTASAIRRTFVAVLGRPGHFVLGAPELEDIVGRLS